MACKDCASGTLHSGTPTGHEETLYGLKTYIADPPNDAQVKGTIVIIPDAFGYTLNNNRILADNYAAKGSFRVLLPDFLRGDELPPVMFEYMDGLFAKNPSWNLQSLGKVYYLVLVARYMIPWIIASRTGVTGPLITEWFRKLREDIPTSMKVGAAGFCWGGLHAFLLASNKEKSKDGRSLFDAAFVAHPSQLSVPGDVEKVVLPMSVAVGDDDIQLGGKSLHAAKDILTKRVSVETEFRIYEGATHGFAVRANPAVPKENEQGIEAEDQAISWFNKIFAK